MKAILRKPYKVNISRCDLNGLLSVPNIFSVFMDLAAEHGSMIGLGLDHLGQKGLYWLTVKTKIRIFDRPKMLDEITAVTWPEAPGRVRCNRYYTLEKDGTVLAEGKTEWAIINVSNGSLCKIPEVYPRDIDHVENIVCEGAFSRVSEDFSDDEIAGTYTVRSGDIDVGHHMNNSAYVHALLGAFSNVEIAAMNISEVEIFFRSSCFEGETLTIYRRNTKIGVECGMFHEDGKSAILAKIS